MPANATAVVLNVTSAEARGTGFATAYPCGAARPVASNLNYGVGAPVANSAIVKVGSGGKVCLFTADTSTQLIADVNGWFTSGYSSISPVRLLDTRPGLTTVDGTGAGIGLRRAGSVYELQVTGRAGVPANATAVVLNLTSAEARGTGFATAWPCGTSQPTASNLNYGVGAPVANSAIVKVGTGGKVCLLTADTDTHLIADVNGWFTSGYSSISPVRLLDTRSDDGDSGDGSGAPAGADFYADFNTPGQLQSQFRHALWRRDDTLIGQTEWPADHSLACSTPDQKRIVHRSNPDESFYERAKHLMISEGDAVGILDRLALAEPDVQHVRGRLRVLGSEPDRHGHPPVVRGRGHPGVRRTCSPMRRSPRRSTAGPRSPPTPPDYAVTPWSGPSAWLGKLGINGNVNQAKSFDANADVATRYPMCFKDDGAGTSTTTVSDPVSGAALLSHSARGNSRPGRRR